MGRDGTLSSGTRTPKMLEDEELRMKTSRCGPVVTDEVTGVGEGQG